jgi:predicted CXXCH cytochrome family protein
MKCTACHAGPSHHQNQKGHVPDCAECHRDHRGRDASLLAMDDSACTSCHQNLKDHRDGPALIHGIPNSVSRFAQNEHPDLKAAWNARANDTKRIKFNHARHLSEGLPLKGGGKPWTFADLAERDRDRYGWKAGQRLDTPIKLECAACHETDASKPTPSPGPLAVDSGEPRTPGAYMRPIVFENHCAACHELQFDAKLPNTTMRHGISAKEVFADLKQLYTAETASADPELLRQFVPPRPMPGQPASPVSERIKQAADKRLFTAAKFLFAAAIDEEIRRAAHLPLSRRGCVECHVLKPGAESIVSLKSLASIEIEKPLMTPVWQTRAIFNHTTHRALKCAACHAGVELSEQNGDRLLLPDITNCVTCHTPSSGLNTGEPAAARSACTECHRYHNGDKPDQGLGATARRGPIEQTLEQFLSGAQPRAK